MLEQCLRPQQARSLNNNIRALDRALPIMCHNNFLAEIARQPRAKIIAALNTARMHADLVKIEEMIKQPHIPVRRAARADMAQNP